MGVTHCQLGNTDRSALLSLLRDSQGNQTLEGPGSESLTSGLFLSLLPETKYIHLRVPTGSTPAKEFTDWSHWVTLTPEFQPSQM